MPASLSEKLLEALDKIDRPGLFCVSGSSAPVFPGLEISKLGPVALPLTTQQAKQLREHCEQAPYGKGEQTIVDTKVRRVWQLMPNRFRLTNPAWKNFLRDTLHTVEQELGLEKQKLEAHLYNLLLYEPGCFFLPHRDGEKLDRMVVTLVIVLPSSYEGGELVVRHEGEEKVVDFARGKDSRFLVHFAAFYADCEHEIRPIRKGYRLCLVYNLTLAKGKKGLTAPRCGEHSARIAGIFRNWPAAGPVKLAVTLEHEYTQVGLDWDALKGLDRTRAQVLKEAARAAGCKCYLALLTFHHSNPRGSSRSAANRPRRLRRPCNAGVAAVLRKQCIPILIGTSCYFFIISTNALAACWAMASSSSPLTAPATPTPPTTVLPSFRGTPPMRNRALGTWGNWLKSSFPFLMSSNSSRVEARKLTAVQAFCVAPSTNCCVPLSARRTTSGVPAWSTTATATSVPRSLPALRATWATARAASNVIELRSTVARARGGGLSAVCAVRDRTAISEPSTVAQWMRLMVVYL